MSPSTSPAASALAPRRAARPPLWYRLAWLLALPLAALYLAWRALRQREYLRHWGERFLGAGAARAAPPGAPVIWIHAVSVGETRAAGPLLEQLAQRHPQAHFLLTHMTPTGRAAGREVARGLAARVQQRYLPYDVGFAVRRFLLQTRPDVGVLMETEVWPGLLHGAGRLGVPVLLANARLSARSLDKALRHPRLIRGASAGIAAVAAQSGADRERIARLYDGPVVVTGNLKFDQQPDEAQQARGALLRAQLLARYAPAARGAIWLFASTREGEERLLLDALLARRRRPDGGAAPLCLFVPRHPQRFDEVARLLQDAGAPLLRRAEWESSRAPAPAPAGAGGAPWLLGDSMGEMALYYAMADAALIGGSLLALGGQNLIEACACGCPVVLGPHMFNFSQAAADALQAGAALQVVDAEQGLQAMGRITWEAGLRERMARAGREFAAAHRGATARTCALIEADGRLRDAASLKFQRG
jgi:3-deoxy-D-manno-octulosonic-acid transferase